ncbi:3-carboxy-cis,cis-muconate cycloisomerase [Streptomyces sioyaensis]|uniref:3-carboxy-cis,cis-muconate cycloisomerase n=1 Tax=Streptomyces sioyaensis TaxID=67364 RepID=UPI0037A51FD6
MTSDEALTRPDDASPDAVADLGLLSPVRVASEVEAATGDRAFLQAMLDAEAALTRAQATLGDAPRGAADAVTAAAHADRFDVRDIAVRARRGGNPVIPLVADLTAALPADAAPYVHRGATSQDIMDTATMLVAARTLPLLAADLRRTADTLGRLAEAHRATPMPGRTLTQHAVPTTFGLKAAGWRHLVLDGLERLSAVLLPAQLGGAAGTLAAFETRAGTSAAFETPTGTPGGGPALLAAYARELGLAEPVLPWHTLRTPVADLGSALGFVCGALGKLAVDVLVLSRTEIGELAEGSGGDSSAMPHKSNPVRAALITSAARQAPALAAVLTSALTAEDERPAGAWHAEWQTLRALLRLAGGAARDAAELVDSLRVLSARMHDNLHVTGGLIVSERLAVELGALLGRQPARELLTRAAHRAAAERRSLAAVLAEEPVLAGHLDRMSRLTDPTTYLGAAAALVDRALARKTGSEHRNHP